MIVKSIRLVQSFKDAARGIALVFRSEQNFRIQIVVAGAALIGMAVFPLRQWEIILVILLITMVLTMEMLNTTFEYFTDLLKPRLHSHVRSIKDIMAGAVLLTSLSAFIVGSIIFLPYFISLIK